MINGSRGPSPEVGERSAHSVEPKKHRTGPLRASVAIGLGCIVNPLNSTMIAVAFSDLALTFHRSLADTSWLVTLYLSLTASLQPTAGAIGDRIGRWRIYTLGLVLFGISSMGAACSPRFEVLVLFRCLQAASSSLALPNGISLLRESVAENVRGRAVGTLGAILGIGAAIGLPLGGWIVSSGRWPNLFWVNIPIIAAALTAAWFWVPRVRGAGSRLSPLAILGIALLPFTIGLELLRFPHSRDLGGALLTVSLVLGAVFGLYLRRSAQGRAEISLLSSRPFLASLAAVFFQNFVLYSSLLILPTWLTALLALPPGRSGLYLGGMTLLMVLCSPFAGWISDKAGCRLPAIAGSLMVLSGLAALVRAPADPTRGPVVIGLTLFGLGLGFAAPPVQRAALDLSPADGGSMAMGLFTTARYLGGIVGASTMVSSLTDSSMLDVTQGTGILRTLLLIGTLPAILAAFFLPSRRGPTFKISTPTGNVSAEKEAHIASPAVDRTSAARSVGLRPGPGARGS